MVRVSVTLFCLASHLHKHRITFQAHSRRHVLIIIPIKYELLNNEIVIATSIIVLAYIADYYFHLYDTKIFQNTERQGELM